jgi:hypothetical protein
MNWVQTIANMFLGAAVLAWLLKIVVDGYQFRTRLQEDLKYIIQLEPRYLQIINDNHQSIQSALAAFDSGAGPGTDVQVGFLLSNEYTILPDIYQNVMYLGWNRNAFNYAVRCYDAFGRLIQAMRIYNDELRKFAASREVCILRVMYAALDHVEKNYAEMIYWANEAVFTLSKRRERVITTWKPEHPFPRKPITVRLKPAVAAGTGDDVRQELGKI